MRQVQQTRGSVVFLAKHLNEELSGVLEAYSGTGVRLDHFRYGAFAAGKWQVGQRFIAVDR